MYLKVDNNGDEQLYSFENQKSVVIGRAPSSDIQLVTDGISRKHLEVIEKDGEFTVIDFGSTNGTFLNEDRLDPNIEHPFNSFFPLKLGFHVFLYLVDEVSPEQLKEAVISGMEESETARREEQKAQRKKKIQVQSAGTGSVKLKARKSESASEPIGIAGGNKDRVRKKFNAKKSRARNNDKDDKLNFPLYIGIFALVMAGLAYSQGYLDSFIQDEKAAVVAKPIVRKKPVAKVVPKPINYIPKLEDIRGKMLLDKCLTDLERELCQKIPSDYNRDFNEGFSVLLDTAYFVVDIDKFEFLYTKRELTEEQKSELIELGKQNIGRRFNKDEFIKNNYSLDNFDFSERYVLNLLIADFFQSKYLETIEANELKELVFIAFKGSAIREPYVYAHFDLERLRKIRDNYELAKRAHYSILAKSSVMFNKVLYNYKDFQIKDYLKYIKIFN